MTPIALQFALEDDKVAPGLLGFTVVAVIAAATWLLLKSMTKQLKRVDFEEKTPDRTTADRTGDGDGATGDSANSDADHREPQGNGAK
ncbi:hypothetical protein GCM10023205_29080 [Yinghuangia aomiensis]|uniref:Uncharacterized protein n=1 Tax=Yinghuangia aomiensis TaxID=676205 RepID=A0ABP9H7W4_9ACTN